MKESKIKLKEEKEKCNYLIGVIVLVVLMK
jgi:hypothetical protein